jgi:hypothetical protein
MIRFAYELNSIQALTKSPTCLSVGAPGARMSAQNCDALKE